MNPLKFPVILVVILCLLSSVASAQYQANISVKLINQTEGGQLWGFVNRTMNQSTAYSFNGVGLTYSGINPASNNITFDIFKKGEYIRSIYLTTTSPPECLHGNCLDSANEASSDSVLLKLNDIKSITSTGTITRNISRTLLAPSNDSIVTMTYSGADFALLEITEDIPLIFDVIPVSLNSSMNKTGTLYTFTPLQTLVYKIVLNGSNPALLNKQYTITGTFKDRDLASGVIGTSGNITAVSGNYYLMMRYDSNKDNIINKNEAATATFDYFRTNTMSLTDVIAIVTKYFGGGHIL